MIKLLLILFIGIVPLAGLMYLHGKIKPLSESEQTTGGTGGAG